MADGKEAAAVQMSVANPKQEVNAMENLDKVTSYTTPTYNLETNPTQFKQEKNQSFFDSEAWKDYKSNLLRAYSNEYPGFTSIEKVAENDLWRDSLGANSDFVVKRAQAIHSSYAYATGWWGKLAEAYNAQRFGLRAAAARKDLSDAIREGDELKIAEAKIKYEQEKRRIYERGHEYDEYGNTLMSLAASSGRNWETIPINIAGVFFAPVTGGLSLGASQAINAGIVGADTYRLETGTGLEQLDELDTDLTEEQKFEKAKVSGLTNAFVEAGLFAVGGNLAARGTKSIGKATARYATTKAAQKLAGVEITKEASKSLLKTEFIKALQKPVEKKTFKQILAQYGKDSLFGGLSEGAQEVFQDSMTDAMLRSVQSGKEISEELLEDWADFIVDPFSDKHSQKWETFAAVALASPIFSAGFSGVSAGLEVARTGQVKKGMGNAVDKLKGAMNNNLGLSRLFAIQGEADAKNGTPVSNAVLQEQIRRGEVSGKLYTTVEQVEKMQQDPEVAEALEQMGVAEALENASENGGVVELDFAAYDKIVNESQNQVLFQKMRNYLSFSETTMSIEEYNQFIRDSGKQVATSLAEEIRNDVNSIYNKAKEMFIKAGMEQGEAEGNAAIIHTALTNAKGLTQDKQNDILDRVRVSIEGKDGGNITQKFNEAMASSEVTPEGTRVVNMGDKKQTAISFNKVAKGKDKGKYTVGIKDNTGLSSVMKDIGGWSAPEEQNVTPAVFDTEESARQAVETMYAKTEGDGVTLDVGAAFNEVFAENPKDDAQVYHMFVGSKTTETLDKVADVLGKTKELEEAKKLEDEALGKGETPDYEAIWAKTGWYKEPDSSWTYEIDDSEAEFNDEVLRDKNGILIDKPIHTTLSKVMHHDKLYDMFPELENIPVNFVSNIGHNIAQYNPNDKTLSLNRAYTINFSKQKNRNIEEFIVSEMLHELQHYMQDKLDFMHWSEYKGQRNLHINFGSLTKEQEENVREVNTLAQRILTDIVKKQNIRITRQFDDSARNVFANRNTIYSAAKTEEEKQQVKDFVEKYLDTKDYNLGANEGYLRLAYEEMARNTQTRQFLTEEQRKQVSPSATLDIAGPVQVDVAHDWYELQQNTKQLRTMKFAAVPVEAAQQTEGSYVEAGRTEAWNGYYNIVLTPKANATTFAHEVFHMFSLELQRVYNNGTISDYWKKQADKMFKLIEAEPQVDPVDPTVVRYNLTEAQEERLANMFTTYIMKGKIENYEVRGMLAKLIEMFKTVYQQAESRDLTEKALNKKAYDFFNAVISSQETIEEIQRNAGLLEIAEPEGVDRELYDYYIANLAISKVEASDDLRKKLFAIDTFKKSAEYTKLLQKFKDQATEELVDTTRYKVVAQASLYTEDKVEKTTLWAQNEFPELNLTEGDIADILNNTKPLEQAATEQANEEMNDYIAQKYKVSRDELGFKEERNRAKVRALLAESVMRRGGTIKDIDEEIKKAENASDKHLAKISVYQILDLDKWKNREAATVQRYTWAKHNDREDLMSAERFNQAVVNLIMIKANGFKSEYQKITTLFDRLQDRQKQYRRKDENGEPYGPLEHRYHADDWELLRSISEKFGNKIRDKRRSPKTVHQQMKEWIETQVENRFTTVAGLEEYIPFVDKGHDGSVGSMKGKDFKKLWAVIGTINGVAMREQQLFLDGQYEELASYVKQTVDFFKDMEIDIEGKGFFGLTSGEFLGKYGTWTNPEPLARAIFPPEVFRKIFLPMFEGATKSEAVAKEWIDRWNAAKKKINTSTQEFVLDDGSRITYGVETQKVMTYGDVANLLIAMGAEHSYENYKLKFGLTDEQAYRIASQAIKRNKAYVDFMNETWKVYGEATEKLNASFKERNNELFVEKKHRAFEIDGIKFEGGYVPEDKHYQALVRELGTWNQGNKMHNKKVWKNEQILTKAADGDVLSIIDITEMKLSQSAKWIYAATPYNNIKKFLEDTTINDTIGDRIFAFFRDWLQNWDTPHFDESGMWRPLSRMTTLSALSMRASTALLQLSGLVQATAVLKPVYVGRGMLQFIRENGFFRPFKIQEKKSLYMASRVANPFANKMGMDIEGATFKEMFDKYNRKTALGKVGAALLTAYQRIGMSMIQLVDGWVATITWNGAFARAKDNGLSDEEAKLEADSIVRITQSDAMQISRSAAMQEPWARAVTAFGTWTMGMRSQTQALKTSKNYRMEYVAWTFSWVVVASLIEAYLKDLTEPSDDDDKETLERIKKSWYNKIAEAVGTQMLPFGGVGSAATKTIARALEPADDDQIFEVFAGGNVSALQYAYRMAESTAKLIDYMQTGEEEQRNKFFIAASGLVSNNIKKHVKKALED